MYKPEDLARHLTDTSGCSWTIEPLPEAAYGQTTAAYTTSGTVSVWAVVVDTEVFGRSLYVVANLGGKQFSGTISLWGRGIYDTICRWLQHMKDENDS